MTEELIKCEPVEVEEEEEDGMSISTGPADNIDLPQVRNKSVTGLLQEVRECLNVTRGDDGQRKTRNQTKREREADLQREKPAKKSRLSAGIEERMDEEDEEYEEVEQKYVIPNSENKSAKPRSAVNTPPRGKAKRSNKRKVLTPAERERGSLRKRQRYAEMSEEERKKIRAKATEDKRRRRAQLRIEAEQVKLAKEELIKKHGENAPELEKKSLTSLLDEIRERNKLKQRERRAQMTEEEREAIRKRNKESQRRQREALRKLAAEKGPDLEEEESETVLEDPHKIEELKKMEARVQAFERQKERNRLQLQEKRRKMTEAERKIHLTQKREQTRQRRKNLQDPVAQELVSSGGVEGAHLTEEEKESLAKLEEIRKKKRENIKLKREKERLMRLKLGLQPAPRLTKEERKLEMKYAMAVKRRRERPESTPEEDAAFLELEKTRFRALEERRRKLRDLPEMTEEERRKWIEKEKEKAERNLAKGQERRAKRTDEEKEQRRVKEYLRRCAVRAERRGEEESPEEKLRKLEFARQWRHSLSGEKRQRYRDSVARAHKKRLDKLKQDPVLWQQYKDKMNAMLRNRTKKETPEQRQKRLLKYKLCQSRKKFRQDLEDSGLCEEEIQMRTEEFTESFYIENPIARPTTRRGRRPLVMVGVSERVEIPAAPHPILNVRSISNSQPATESDSVMENQVSSQMETRLSSSQSDTDLVQAEVPSLAFDRHNDQVEDDNQLYGLEASFQDDFDDDCDYNSLDDAGHGEEAFEAPAAAGDSLSVPAPTLEKEPSPERKPAENKNELKVEPEHSVPQTESKARRRKTTLTTFEMCEDCGKVLADHRNYLRHRRLVHEPPRECPHPQCDFTYKFSRHLWKHFRQVHVHQERPEIIAETPAVLEPKPKRRPQRAIINKPSAEKSCNMCPECGKIFKTKCTLDDHIRRVHQGKGFYCDLCRSGGDLQSAGKLWKHKVEKHGMTDLPPPPNIQVTECEFCGETVLRSYKHHILKKHPEMKDHIPDFVLEMKAMEQIEVHADECEVPGCVKCPKCSTVIQKQSLKRHLRCVHGIGEQKRFPCPHCGYEFKHRNHLNEHLRRCIEKKVMGLSLKERFPRGKRPPNKSNPCVLCGAKFVLRRELQEHLKESHPQEYESMEKGENPTNIPLECQSCSESFSDLDLLRKHLESTHPEASLKCPDCGKVMLSSVELALHISMDHHSIVDKVKKPRKNYPRRTKRKRQRKTPLPRCFRCDEEFPTPTEVSEHVQSAHPSCYFPCPHCSSLFYTERVLAFHIVGNCKKIEDKAAAKKEMVQNGQIPIHLVKIKCKLCSAGVLVSTLTKHMRRSHETTETSFECEQCQKTFKTSEYWIAHLENQHGTLVEEVYEIASENEDEEVVDKKKKTTKASVQRKRSKTGSKRGRGRPSKRKLESEDEENEEDQLENIEDAIPTETRRRGPRRRSRRVVNSFNDTVTQPCFVRLIRMSDEEINALLYSNQVKVEPL